MGEGPLWAEVVELFADLDTTVAHDLRARMESSIDECSRDMASMDCERPLGAAYPMRDTVADMKLLDACSYLQSRMAGRVQRKRNSGQAPYDVIGRNTAAGIGCLAPRNIERNTRARQIDEDWY